VNKETQEIGKKESRKGNHDQSHRDAGLVQRCNNFETE
jgi:hypothetical protein